MRLVIAAVGRLKNAPEALLVEDYSARIRASGRNLGFSSFEIREVEAPRGLETPIRKLREAEMLMGCVSSGAHLAALDEQGDSLSSSAFADRLAKWRDEGVPSVGFFIGGADGHGPVVTNAAQTRLAFGRATWPHMFVRTMLCEQLYRAMTILSGHPYHRG